MKSQPRTIEDFGHQFKVHDDEVNFKTCPMCGDTRWKVSVNARTGLWHCFSGSCGAGGHIDVGIDPASLLGFVARRQRPAAQDAPWSWPEVTIDGAEVGVLGAIGASYLLKRGFSPTALAIDYHIFSTPNQIIIPFFDPLGRPIYWTSRDLTGERQQKYLNMPGKRPLYVPHFAIPAAMRRVPSLVVVEGVFDAIRVHQAGFCVAAIGGTALPEYLRRDLLDLVLPAGRIHVMLDSDAMANNIKLGVALTSARDTVMHILPRGADPGGMTEDQIRELMYE